MRKKCEHPDIVVLKHIWPALVFTAAWLWFPETRTHLSVGVHWVYLLLGVVGAGTYYRMRVALCWPGAPVLKYMPVFDAVTLAPIIRFTGGVRSDLWLFYYFQLIAGAMDTQQRTIEFSGPLVILSYLVATFQDVVYGDWDMIEIVITRLFFLFLTAMIARQVALSRNQLSEELSQLSEQLTLSQERNRIAREIHDGVGHSLVNCILTLELCSKLVCDKPSEACKIIEQEKADLRTALEDMRDYVHQLRPAEVEEEQFVPMIDRHLSRFADRTGLSVRLDVQHKAVDLPPSGRLVLLRILQEALTNAAKHSDATEITVSLARTGDCGVHCTITDNGRGFDEQEVLLDPGSRQGFGLRTMKDRAFSVGGDVQIESAFGEGTKVSVYIPG